MPTEKIDSKKSNQKKDLDETNRIVSINPKIFYQKLTELWKALMQFALTLNEGKCNTGNCENKGIERLHGYCEECYAVWFYLWGTKDDPVPTYRTIIEKQLLALRTQKEKQKGKDQKWEI